MFLLHNFFVMFSAEHSLFQISCLMKSFQIQYQIPVIEWWLSNGKKRKSRVRSKGDGGSTWSHGGPSPDSYKYLSSLVIALCFTFRNSRSNRMLFRIPGSVMWSVYNHCISTFIFYKWLNETNSVFFLQIVSDHPNFLLLIYSPVSFIIITIIIYISVYFSIYLLRIRQGESQTWA